MVVIYPINGKNERMGSLFSTPKHLLLLEGKELILQSINTINETYSNPKIIILTNNNYYNRLYDLTHTINNIELKLIGETNSHVETLRKITVDLTGSVMFVDCDIMPIKLTKFDKKYPTVFTFKNTSKLLNYSNFKVKQSKIILDCNEKEKPYKNAGAGIYYFPDISIFNHYSENYTSVSGCIKHMIDEGVKTKINDDSVINRYGTLQDIYIDNFSFRQHNTKNLSTGFTNNIVFKNKNTIIKNGSTILDEVIWYQSYKNKKNIPNIIKYDNNSLVLEYIKRNDDINLDDILELITHYKNYDKLNNLGFEYYIQNISNHLSNNKTITNGYMLLNALNLLKIIPTFCHGDLSVMNIIPTKLGLKLIDPLYSKDKYGSYELDIAKLCFSYKFYKNDSASFNYIKNKSHISYLDILIAAEAVRVSSYKKEYSFIAENLINELTNYL
jgi:hypothetical protein